jgi:superfamily II DNA or RNA helicase
VATFDEFLTSLDRDFGEQGKGKPFEVFCKWFLENDPKWAGEVEKVWLWDEYPDRWQGKDLGTDLVFRDNKGKIWAVQAKCYAEHRSPAKKELNSFLADAGREQVDCMLWMQTTDNIGINVAASLVRRDKPVTIFKLTDFRDAQIDYPASFAELRKASVKPKPSPEPHQIEAIEAATKGLSDNDRGQMIMACGTGKTFTTLWVKEALNAHTTLVLLPSLSLLSQTMREWAWAKNEDFKILNVCSDTSVGKKTEDMDPADAPFPVTSDVEEIALFLKKPEAKVIFCTYQSSGLIAQAQLDDGIPSFDLAVADEAHRCAGKADAGFATILDVDKIRANKRLFTTATPRYFGKAIKDEANARDLEVVGMDNEAVFGPVVHKLTFGQAIERELLTDYQVVIVGVDEPMVREWIEREEIVATDPDNQTDARTLAAKIGLIKAIKDYDLQRVISFHSRVNGARDFSRELADVINLVEPEHRPSGAFLSDYVSGEMKAGDRKRKIDRLKALDGFDRGILTNARCLAEGVDVPSLDGVAFIDPRGSQIEIIQAVGRAIRKVRGAAVQKVGTIVIPVFIERGDNPEAAIEASNFKPVWDVLKALKSHDEVLAETLDQYRTNMAKNASQNRERISDKIIFDLPATVDVEFSAALRTVLVEATTASWEFWFGLLEQFKEREGHCRVTRGFKEGKYHLDHWVFNQRAQKERLSPDRVLRLNRLGFVWDHFSEYWEEGFRHLKIFKEREGHCRVPRGFVEGEFALGSWVGNQRASQDSIDQDRLEKLNGIGFVWDPHSEAWEEGFSHLKAFREREGHCRVHVGQTEKGFQLGRWVSRQRTDIITPDRRQRLEAIGFTWDALGERWEEAYASLKAFYEREGHCRVPTGHIEAGIKLGQWIRVQRTQDAKMSSDRRQKLDDLGFVWDALADQWEEGFSHLQKFRASKGHCQVPTSFKDGGFGLGAWVATQRSRRGSTNLDRVKRLDELGFVWEPRVEGWQEGFFHLMAFVDLEQHARVPQKHITASRFKLGIWLTNIRAKKDSLLVHQIEQLEKLPGWSWSPREDAWRCGIAALSKFAIEYGHVTPTREYIDTEGFKLGAWVAETRSNKSNMPSERLQQLEEFEGWTWNAVDTKWKADLAELETFVAEHGSCRVPRSYISPTGFKLGEWCKGIRIRYKNASPIDSKRQALDRLGFIWDPHQDAWELGYETLRAFKEREGHCKVSSTYTENDFKLGRWVANQRVNYTHLPQERRDRLDAIGFVWSAK